MALKVRRPKVGCELTRLRVDMLQNDKRMTWVSVIIVCQIALDLDLFTIKLLINRYGVQIKCSRDENTGENSCAFIFPSDKS